jgi:hypothetical protein
MLTIYAGPCFTSSAAPIAVTSARGRKDIIVGATICLFVKRQ